MTDPARDLALSHFQWIDGHADVWRIFRDPAALSGVVRGLAATFESEGITAVCGIESRGFLLGAAVALELGVGFIAVRKQDGLFPGEKITRRTPPDYRRLRHELRMQRASLTAGDRVLLVDDWIETGSQAASVKSMVEEGGSRWGGCAVIVDQTSESCRRKLDVRGLVRAAELPVWSSQH
ncbi:phosphoribosyltransferase family protein [Streptomyces sp. DSM 3412]|uniref:Phosphoribosyltransferase family protein n=1 Tax=Streptomyces gottesmaniae TaxID=3075518 RepID=A0ABU2YRJ2_9ACTN|nr:phosphoribosyltransferase family protein [Streptomyces sp. DSM 3412]MDT0566935.1 phosphoribosyltransferase family protein [Streptomyces sp. DSM 3412]